MDLIFRRIDLEDEEELRTICKIDVTIPAIFDDAYPTDENAIADRILDLQKRFGPEDFLEVATDVNGRIVGFHIVKKTNWFGKPAGTVFTLWVLPEFRRIGIAQFLKKRAEEWARSRGWTHLDTWVHAKNANMLSLNTQMGYETVSFKMQKKL